METCQQAWVHLRQNSCGRLPFRVQNQPNVIANLTRKQLSKNTGEQYLSLFYPLKLIDESITDAVISVFVKNAILVARIAGNYVLHVSDRVS